MVSRYGGAAFVLALMLGTVPVAWAAGAVPVAAARSTPSAPAAHLVPAPASATAAGRSDPNAQPQVSQDAAARARMHECAHQWSSIKKAGNAGATTWKEFSATCLVVSR